MSYSQEAALNYVRSKLDVKKEVNGLFYCHCPAHKDEKPSLHMTLGSKKIVLDCKAGCDFDSICSSANIEPSKLYFDSWEEERICSISDWQKYVERRESSKIEAVYHYHNVEGVYCFTKLRLSGKKLLYGMLKNNRFSYGLPRSTPRKSFRAIYGDLNAVKNAVSSNSYIFVPEGEKDVDMLKSKGYAAITYGGATDWNTNLTEFFKDAKVIVLADNDAPGAKVANQIKSDLEGVAKTVYVVTPMPDKPHGDVTDFFEAGYTTADFETLIKDVSSKKEELPKSALAQQEIVKKLFELGAAENYPTNDKGYGKLFADVFKDKHRYNSTLRDFMVYDGKRWVLDSEGLAARNDAKILSDALLIYGAQTDANYLKRVVGLCNLKNRNSMISDAKDFYYFCNEEFDLNDYKLNLLNGTLDISADKVVLNPHDPEDKLSKLCNVEHDPDAKSEVWDKFLDQIMLEDKEKIRYLQKIAGLSLTGNTEIESCFILYGSTTRNGKSTFCETLLYLLGDYALTMKPETLALKQNTDSSRASGDIARLAGCRFCNASEPPKRMLFDAALLKTLLGRDSITARHLYQREFNFIPKFKLLINTNYLPQITDETLFTSGRINVVSFDRHFEPSEQDKKLKNKLREPAELSGILNWCLEGLRLYRCEGLEPPEAVKAATESYREASDKIGNFISECLVPSERNSKAGDIYDAYAVWCYDCGYGVESKGNFFSELKTKGIFATTGTVDGKTVKNVVCKYIIDTEIAEISRKNSFIC